MSIPRVLGRLRWAPLSLVAGVVATGAVALSMNGTLAAFTASITHNGNRASTGTLTMRLANANGSVSCSSTDGTDINGNTASCSGVNHYGGATQSLGVVTYTTVTVANTGTVAANGFTLKFGTCATGTNTALNNIAGNATDICDKVTVAANITVNGQTTSALAGSFTLSALAAKPAFTLPAVAAGASASVTFATTVPTTVGNSYQGLSATQPLTWQFTS